MEFEINKEVQIYDKRCQIGIYPKTIGWKLSKNGEQYGEYTEYSTQKERATFLKKADRKITKLKKGIRLQSKLLLQEKE